MPAAFPKITMTKTEFKANSQKIVLVAQTIASFTPTQKDDQVVSIFNNLVNNAEMFDQLCELLGITDTPVTV